MRISCSCGRLLSDGSVVIPKEPKDRTLQRIDDKFRGATAKKTRSNFRLQKLAPLRKTKKAANNDLCDILTLCRTKCGKIKLLK